MIYRLASRPQSVKAFLRNVSMGVGFAALAFGASKLILSFLPHAGDGARSVLPHTALEMIAWMLLAVSAGIVDETVYRGYLQQQFQLMGTPLLFALIAQAGLFGIGHLYQGWPHAILRHDCLSSGRLASESRPHSGKSKFTEIWKHCPRHVHAGPGQTQQELQFD